MLTCHHCRKSFQPHEPADVATCPHCRAEVVAEAEVQWSSVARCTNLAEAGFLANDLVGQGLDARIEQHDSFSAVDGSWLSMFLIQVPAEVADDAAQRVREQLEEAGDDDRLVAVDQAQAPGDSPTVIWRPLALMAVAGVAILLIGHRMRELRARQPDPPNRATLLEVLKRIDRPLTTESKPGERGYRLWFDESQRTWHIAEDVNGDGRYDRELRLVETIE